MPLDMNWLLLSMLISSIGVGLLIYGWKQSRVIHVLVGIIYSIYPYFISSLFWMTFIAVLLGAGLWLVVHKGWFE